MKFMLLNPDSLSLLLILFNNTRVYSILAILNKADKNPGAASTSCFIFHKGNSMFSLRLRHGRIHLKWYCAHNRCFSLIVARTLHLTGRNEHPRAESASRFRAQALQVPSGCTPRACLLTPHSSTTNCRVLEPLLVHSTPH